jgi:hypothetical protein
VVEAGIQTLRGVYPARLLLDSGADCTMLPKSFGELIGLDFGRLPALTVTGIEGRGMKAFKGPLCLQIGGLKLPPIPCLYAASDRTPLLLGREGFFDLFDICFDNRHKKLALTRLF